jgi:aspartate racemase
MNSENRAIIGIVGGMGPHSGFFLANEITDLTKVETDQEHLSTIVMSYPSRIADRSRFLSGKISVNPAYEILNVIGKLEYAGANIIGIACNTAHCPDIFDVIKSGLENRRSVVKLLHMPDETCQYMFLNHPHVQRVGLMSTNGMYNSGLYQKTLEQFGYEVIIPDAEFQDQVIHRMIYDSKFGIKTGKPGGSAINTLLRKTINFFKNHGTDAIVLGCTEFSLMMPKDSVYGMTLIDSSKCLARALISQAQNWEKVPQLEGMVMKAS